MRKHVFLSHDVDWRFGGPPREHILARRDRFDQSVLENLDTINPYDNFNQIMTIEEKYGCRSTFFFRTKYENGDFRDYEDQIRELEQGGWEIGLHLDPDSVGSPSEIAKEYHDLSSIAKNKIVGNRVHFLNYDESMLAVLKGLGITYDATLKHSRSELVDGDFGFYRKEIVQFPVTTADVCMFVHMDTSEEGILPFVGNVLDRTKDIFSLIWHDNTLRMKKGRKFPDVMEYLHSRDVVFCTGKEACGLVNSGAFGEGQHGDTDSV